LGAYSKRDLSDYLQRDNQSLENAPKAKPVDIKPLYIFSGELCERYVFDTEADISWRGNVTAQKAEWVASSIEIGLELFNYVLMANLGGS